MVFVLVWFLVSQAVGYWFWAAPHPSFYLAGFLVQLVQGGIPLFHFSQLPLVGFLVGVVAMVWFRRVAPLVLVSHFPLFSLGLGLGLFSIGLGVVVWVGSGAGVGIRFAFGWADKVWFYGLGWVQCPLVWFWLGHFGTSPCFPLYYSLKNHFLGLVH